MIYVPDKWKMVKIDVDPEGDKPSVVYKVFAVWFGGYAKGDSWKLNSGVVSVNMEGDFYNFVGSSGSTYKCHKESYGTNLYGDSVLQNLLNTMNSSNRYRATILPAETNFLELAYE